MEWHQFALVLTVPSDRKGEWDSLLDRAVAPNGIRFEKRHATLLILEVQAQMEFMAIERATQWLQTLSEQASPPFHIETNAQPAHEIDC